MLLFLSLAGIILSIILIYFNFNRYKSSIYLGAFFFLVSLYGFIEYVIFYSRDTFLIALTYINFAFFTYLIGPALYVYIRSVLADKARISRGDAWHLLPAIIFLLSSVPHLFSPWSSKLSDAGEILKDPGFLGMNSATLLSDLIPNKWIYLSRPLLVLAYTLWSVVILIRYLAENKESKVFTNQRYMVQWLSVLLGSLLVLCMCQGVLVLQAFEHRDSTLFFTMNLLQMLSVAGLLGLLISPYFFPGILYGLPRLPVSVLKDTTVLARETVTPKEERKFHNYETDYMQEIGAKMMACMEQSKPYLSARFNLNQLAVAIDVPVHHLAFYFREVKKQSFMDFRNDMRISHAKKLILDGKASDLTLEAIGLASGFSSRNTFFTAFKKAEGISPSLYLDRIKS